jgi:hypothetical protein
MDPFEKELLDYLLADAGLADYVVGRIYHVEAAAGASRPHIVVKGIGGDNFAMTLAVQKGRTRRFQCSIYTDRTPAGRRQGVEIRSLVAELLRTMRGTYGAYTVDRVRVAVGPELVEDDQYHFPVDGLPEYTRA